MTFNVKAPGWAEALRPTFQSESVRRFSDELIVRYTFEKVLPDYDRIFAALEVCDLPNVRVVLFGQDPYHTPGVANGMAFSSQDPAYWPPSLKNVHIELQAAYGKGLASPTLVGWAQQGVLLLNTGLTVRAGHALSHGHLPWDLVVQPIIEILLTQSQPIVYLLLGKHAQKLLKGVQLPTNQRKVETSHPSPLGAHQGFLGSRCFEKVNQELVSLGAQPIEWCR